MPSLGNKDLVFVLVRIVVTVNGSGLVSRLGCIRQGKNYFQAKITAYINFGTRFSSCPCISVMSLCGRLVVQGVDKDVDASKGVGARPGFPKLSSKGLERECGS